MRFEVLGPITVGAAPLRGRLRRSLLGLLLVRANDFVPPDVLTGALWDEGGEAKLHWHVHKLRSVLPDRDRLESGPGGYRVVVLPRELDAQRFEELAGEAARNERAEKQSELAWEALSLWRGLPYGGLDVPMLADEALRLDELRMVVIERLHHAELRLGRYAAVAAELAGLVKRHPLRERLHYLLMAALFADGRRAEALEVYRRARRVLVRQLGLEPGAPLRELERRILAGEPAGAGVHPAPARPAVR